ncbi:Agamous-like MADS-box protein [Actinidia chinensis var. chinensis]|uniref:Agamous-like MADS-box protein n=1 Tax=Actinidia chinensis var. chinensis TaxID=1590841 RepID=A0A2R6PP50_ACTCC|nr:Agamous-like MADS-box protein [Actinidia chinensis var. chinensis]
MENMKKRTLSNSETLTNAKKMRRKRNSLPKEFDLNHAYSDEEQFDSSDANDVCDHDVTIDSKSTCRRCDVLSEQCEDKNVPSDYEEDGDANGSREDLEGDEVEEDEGRDGRMLLEITGLPVEALKGERSKSDVIITDAYPVSIYNPNHDAIDGYSGISIRDLLVTLHAKSDFSKLRNNIHQIMPIQELDPECSPEGAIASESEPKSENEERIVPLVNGDEVAESHKEDGAMPFELNKLPAKKQRAGGHGRRKVELKRLENRARRYTTFSKRRNGLFRKMAELCNMCASEAAILTFSEADNIYAFGKPSVNSVVDRYTAGTASASASASAAAAIEHDREQARELEDKCTEALTRLEAEKKRGESVDKVLAVVEGHPIEALRLEDVKQIQAMMEEMVQKTIPPH